MRVHIAFTLNCKCMTQAHKTNVSGVRLSRWTDVSFHREPWHVIKKKRITSPDGCLGSSNKHCIVLILIADLTFHKPPSFKSHHFMLLIERTFWLCVYFSLAVWNFFKLCLTAAHLWFRPASHFFSDVFQKKRYKQIKIDTRSVHSACSWSSLIDGPVFTEHCITASIWIHKWSIGTPIYLVVSCTSASCGQCVTDGIELVWWQKDGALPWSSDIGGGGGWWLLDPEAAETNEAVRTEQ